MITKTSKAPQFFALIVCLFPIALSSAEPMDNPRAVSTFECIGLYWKAPGGGADKICEVSYRAAGEKESQRALPLWFDARDQEYRGSIVHLRPGTTYEVTLKLKGTTERTLKVGTWSEEFPVAKKVVLPGRSRETVTLSQSGARDGYVLYTPGESPGIIDVSGKADYCIVVKASYVIVRGLTLRNAGIHGILLGDGVHDVDH